jgi:hypothetical protein
MKRIFPILFSLLVFLSGMHISLATHYCQGKIAATKFSFSGEKASCGMEDCASGCPVKGIHISSDCCKDEVSVYATDTNYTPSGFQIKKTTQTVLRIIFIPVKYSLALLNFSTTSLTNMGPPGYFLNAAMSLPRICVFRI